MIVIPSDHCESGIIAVIERRDPAEVGYSARYVQFGVSVAERQSIRDPVEVGIPHDHVRAEPALLPIVELASGLDPRRSEADRDFDIHATDCMDHLGMHRILVFPEPHHHMKASLS